MKRLTAEFIIRILDQLEQTVKSMELDERASELAYESVIKELRKTLNDFPGEVLNILGMPKNESPKVAEKWPANLLPVDLQLELDRLERKPLSQREMDLIELAGFPARALYEFWKLRQN